MLVARRVEAANVSDRRVVARLLAGLQSGFPSIQTVMADAGYESRKLARELKQCHGWRLHITKCRQRAFKVVGLTWIVERTFAWLARNRRLSKDYELKVQTSEAFIDLRPSASRSNGSPRGKTSQTPSNTCLLLAVGQAQSFLHAREPKKFPRKCSAKRSFSLSTSDIHVARHWPCLKKQKGAKHMRPSGTGSFCIATQALRTWLLSCCPSRTTFAERLIGFPPSGS
jgi:transposase